MVTDMQVRRLMALIGRGKRFSAAALMVGMDEKTARKYRRLSLSPLFRQKTGFFKVD